MYPTHLHTYQRIQELDFSEKEKFQKQNARPTILIYYKSQFILQKIDQRLFKEKY